MPPRATAITSFTRASGSRCPSRAAKEYLARKRPDIQIVGDDFVPIATVRDFAPYIAKIQASGADTVITSNWGRRREHRLRLPL